MLRDLLVGLAKGTEGLEVVDTVLSHHDVSGQIRSAGSNIVVFRREDPGLPSWAADLLDRHPRLRFLSLDAGGRSGDLYEHRLVHRRIDEISADALIAALHEPAESEERTWPSTSPPTSSPP
jgi:hypothetical protein